MGPFENILRLVGIATIMILAAHGVLVLIERSWFKGKSTAFVENGARYLAAAIQVFCEKNQRLPCSPDTRGLLSLDELWRTLEPRDDLDQSTSFLYLGSGRNWSHERRFVDAWRRYYLVAVTNLPDLGTLLIRVEAGELDGELDTHDDIGQSLHRRAQAP